MEKIVSLYNVDGSSLYADVSVPIEPEGDFDVILWHDLWFKKVAENVYWECVNVIVL